MTARPTRAKSFPYACSAPHRFKAQPNNRLQWFCPAFVTPFQEKPDYVTNTRIWKVERETETTQAFFYESSDSGQASQTSLYVKGLRTPG